MQAEALLLELIRIAVCGKPADPALTEYCTPEILEKLYAVARRHDLLHLAGHGLSKLQLPESELLSKFKNTALQALYRYVQRDYELAKACEALEAAQIPFVPLKGSVLRQYYPEAWMRNSCDTDILVKEEQLEAAIEALVNTCGYVRKYQSDHDVLLTSSTGLSLELHYDTIQERYDETGSRKVLQRLWETAAAKTEGSCHMLLSDEMFYFYHMAHMVKHFEVGGCGVRAFLDIWIMQNRMPENREKRDTLLQEGGLLQFAKAAEDLSRCWFDGETPDDMTRTVSDYILRASLYGDDDNRAALGQARMGKWKYLLCRRIFMPYAFLKDEYPILKKHKWLTPIYQVVRWARMLLAGRLKRTVRELQANATVDKTSTDTAADILKHLGL